ncbi:MAG TPA: phosphoribosyltransferase family protein [Streptosporangiaceae bacterium]
MGAPLDVFLVRKLGVPGRELLRREQAYRQGRLFPDVAGKVVILVDDGLATGSSMRAAIEALRRLEPRRIVVATPAAPESTCREPTALADEVVCATTPSPFFAVGNSYCDFTQTTDEEVRDLLRAAQGPQGPPRATATTSRPTDAAVIRADALPVEEGAPGRPRPVRSRG